MKRYHLILIVVFTAALFFWVGYTCGLDTGQQNYEMSLDIKEGAQP